MIILNDEINKWILKTKLLDNVSVIYDKRKSEEDLSTKYNDKLEYNSIIIDDGCISTFELPKFIDELYEVHSGFKCDTLVLNESLRSIGEGFSRFAQVKSIISNSRHLYIQSETFVNSRYLKAFKFSGEITLGNHCFFNCRSINTLNFSEVTYGRISDYAFGQCYNLENIIGFDSVKSLELGDSCFSSCDELKSIKLPKEVSMHGKCFAKCMSLREVVFQDIKSCEVGHVFQGCRPDLVIYLPNKYKDNLDTNLYFGRDKNGGCFRNIKYY